MRPKSVLSPLSCASQVFVTFVGTGKFQSSWLVSSGRNWVSWQSHCTCGGRPVGVGFEWELSVSVNPVIDEGIVSQTCCSKVGKGWLYLIICTWFWTAEGEFRKEEFKSCVWIYLWQSGPEVILDAVTKHSLDAVCRFTSGRYLCCKPS